MTKKLQISHLRFLELLFRAFALLRDVIELRCDVIPFLRDVTQLLSFAAVQRQAFLQLLLQTVHRARCSLIRPEKVVPINSTRIDTNIEI